MAGMITPDAALVDRILDLAPSERRLLIAIAGAPASGKSTLAKALTGALNDKGRRTENVPMDGYHLDNRLLDARNLRARKGAPETFDAAGFVSLIHRLRTEDDVYYPLFDRSHDQAIAGAGHVSASCELVVVEGNYLLFDADPWRLLAPIWDLSIWLETDTATLRRRCTARWLDLGYSTNDAAAKAEGNDLKNAALIAGARLEADVVMTGASLDLI